MENFSESNLASNPDLWDFKVRMYNRAGELLIETVHSGESSRDVTVDAGRYRMSRGEVSKIEIFDCRSFRLINTIVPRNSRMV